MNGRQMGHGPQVHDLLGRGGRQQGEAGGPHAHDVGVVAEDAEGVGGEGPGGDVEHAGEHLPRDFVHVGNHEEQALGGGVGGGQGPGLEGAVDGPRRAALGLHLHHLGGLTEEVLFPVGGPLVHMLRHGRGRGDGEDARHLREGVGDVRRRLVPVHDLFFLSHLLPFQLPGNPAASAFTVVQHLCQGDVKLVPLSDGQVRLFSGVIVKTGAALDPVSALGDNLVQEGVTLLGVGKAGVQILVDPVKGIQSPQVAHPEGTQRGVPQTQARLEHGVHVLHIRDAVFHDVQSLSQHGVLQAVENESVDIFFHDNRFLAQRLYQAVHFLDIGVLRLLAPDDLAQRQQMRGVEPVLSHEALRAVYRLRHLADEQSAGIGGQQGLVGNDAAGLGPKGVLGLHVFNDGLHHQIAAPHAVLGGGKRNVVQKGGGPRLCQKPLLAKRFLIEGDQASGSFQTGLGAVPQENPPARLCVNLREGRAHHAGSG